MLLLKHREAGGGAEQVCGAPYSMAVLRHCHETLQACELKLELPATRIPFEFTE